MKRSSFLKVLGLSAATSLFRVAPAMAAPVIQKPKPPFELPELPEALSSNDILRNILALEDTQEFARDGIIPTEFIPMINLRHLALQSAMMQPGEEMCAGRVRDFVQTIQRVLECAVRDIASVPVDPHMEVYEDWLPARYNDGVRISPYVQTAYESGLVMEINPAWENAKEERRIAKPLRPVFQMRMEIKAHGIWPSEETEAWPPEASKDGMIGWAVRALFQRSTMPAWMHVVSKNQGSALFPERLKA